MANCFAQPFGLLDHLRLLGLVFVSISISKKAYEIQGMFVHIIILYITTLIFFVKLIKEHDLFVFVDES